MTKRNTIEVWDRLSSTPDESISLLRTALLVAQDEYPALDIGDYEAELGRHAGVLGKRLAGLREPHLQLSELNHYLFVDQGFSGNHGDYYDPRNCYINDVLDRKLGIPITLALVQIELAQRVGVPLEGVSFPGHFLVRMPLDDGLIVLDPYLQGRSIDADELKQRVRPHVGGQDIEDHELMSILEPASHRSILSRILRNLKVVYAEREDWDKALRCADRLVRVNPELPDERRDRGLLYLQIGHHAAARDDLGRYLALQPQADDTEAIRVALIEASGSRSRLN